MLNSIIHGDCLEVMKEIPDNSVDMVLTDPPYLMNYRSNRRTKTEKFKHITNDKDSHDMISEFIKESHRIMKDDTAIYLFCSWHHIDFFKTEFEKYFNLKNLIVWNKNNHGSGDLKGSYAPKHEFILYGHKGRSLFRGKRIPDVINIAKVPGSKMVHPTEKPIELLEIFINNNSDSDSLIFDGFAGSSTLAIACINTNRNYICIEKEKEYVDISNKRISDLLRSTS